jgi:hypothetical protein
MPFLPAHPASPDLVKLVRLDVLAQRVLWFVQVEMCRVRLELRDLLEREFFFLPFLSGGAKTPTGQVHRAG